DPPGDGGVVVARVDQTENPGNEEQEVEGEVERGLAAGLHIDVDEVGAHVAAGGQRVGAAHHEQRAVQHVVEVEDPRGRSIEDVSLEHFDGDDEGERDDQPGRGL